MLKDLKVTKREGSRMLQYATWVSGTYKDYRWQAQIFPVGSKYGINKGRVSRLLITDKDNNWLYHFERGLDVRSKSKEVTMLKNYIVAHSLELKGNRSRRKK